MEGKILILIAMIFCHIVDDYYLQGILASMKQKVWWEENLPDPLYKYDYIFALIAHGFSWTFSIMLIPTIYIVLCGGTWYPMLFLGNMMLHSYIDDLKANKKKINLWCDQLLHMMQIIITWWILLG